MLPSSKSLLALAAFGAALLPLHAAEPGLWKFSFAPGKAPGGYVQVAPGVPYAKETGYGFEPGSQVTAVDRPDQHGFATGSAPFYFSVALPEGNYRVTVTLGDSAGESTTTVKAEVRRLVLQNIHTAAGQTVQRTFTVALRRPEFPGGGMVRLKPREKTTDVWDWDDKLTLEFCDQRPCVSSVEISRADDLPTFFLVGDSTMCDQSREPYNSWGQMITRFFGPGIVLSNHAESGETARSQLGERRWPKIMSLIRKGDYLCVQLGHNDQKDSAPGAGAFTSYQGFLKQFVTETRAHGAIPILITPMNRLSFAGSQVTNSLGDFPEAVRREAKEDNVPLIDLNAMSKVLYETLGPAGAPALFATTGTHTDATHQGDYGSYELAQCIVTGIRSVVPDLAQYLAPDASHFDPAHPDPISAFAVPKESVTTTERPYGN